MTPKPALSAVEGFSWEDFVERNNPVLPVPSVAEGSANEGNELVATWGTQSVANRMLSFAYKRFDGQVPEPGELDDEDRVLLEKVEADFQTVGDLYNAREFRAALGEALSLAREASGYLDQAMQQVEEILAYLQSGTLAGTDEPALVYRSCYRVLQAFGDPRAAGVLEAGDQFLQEIAGKMTDDDLRRSFLENVTWHRELIHEYERLES